MAKPKRAATASRAPRTKRDGKERAKAKRTGNGKGKSTVNAKAKPKPKAKAKAKVKSTSKTRVKSKPKPSSRENGRPRAERTVDSPAAAEVYTSQVADIIRNRSRASTYRPVTVLNLSLARVRTPATVDQLSPAERAQLAIIWHPIPLEQVLGNEEFGVEVAEVVDAMGTLRYRLYGWNFGVGYLMPPDGTSVVAFAAQHDLEHWNLDQRDLFVAMDRAMTAPGHGFQQPLSFCWWDDACWQALAGKEPGTVGSEPHLRQTFAAAMATRA